MIITDLFEQATVCAGLRVLVNALTKGGTAAPSPEMETVARTAEDLLKRFTPKKGQQP